MYNLEVKKIEQLNDDIFEVTFFENGVKTVRKYSLEGLKLATAEVNKNKSQYKRHSAIKKAIEEFLKPKDSHKKEEQGVKDVKANK